MAAFVEDRAEIEPAPSEYLDAGEVGLPSLVDASCLIFEFVCRLEYDERTIGDQIMRLQHLIHSGF